MLRAQSRGAIDIAVPPAILIALLTGTISGCATLQPEPQGQLEPLTLQSLTDARNLWQSAAIKSYDYLPKCVFFISGTRIHPTRVVVRNGRVINADDFGKNDPDLMTSAPATIDRTFEELELRLENQAKSHTQYAAYFHPTLGYPVEMAQTPTRGDIQDAGSVCTITQFRIRWP